MISDTVSDVELTSRLLGRHADDEVSCCPEIVVSISFLREIPLSFSLILNLGHGYRVSQLVDALVSG